MKGRSKFMSKKISFILKIRKWKQICKISIVIGSKCTQGLKLYEQKKIITRKRDALILLQWNLRNLDTNMYVYCLLLKVSAAVYPHLNDFTGKLDFR